MVKVKIESMKKSFWIIFLLLLCSNWQINCSSKREIEKPQKSQPADSQSLPSQMKLSFKPALEEGVLNCLFLQIKASFPSSLTPAPGSQKPKGRIMVNRKEIDFDQLDEFQCDKICRITLNEVSLRSGKNRVKIEVRYPEDGNMERELSFRVPEIIKTDLKTIGEHPEKYIGKIVCLKGLAVGWVKVKLTAAEKKFTEKKVLAKNNWAKSRSDGSFYDSTAWAYYPGFMIGAEWQEICARVISVKNQDKTKMLWQLEPTCSRKIVPLIEPKRKKK